MIDRRGMEVLGTKIVTLESLYNHLFLYRSAFLSGNVMCKDMTTAKKSILEGFTICSRSTHLRP